MSVAVVVAGEEVEEEEEEEEAEKVVVDDSSTVGRWMGGSDAGERFFITRTDGNRSGESSACSSVALPCLLAG